MRLLIIAATGLFCSLAQPASAAPCGEGTKPLQYRVLTPNGTRAKECGAELTVGLKYVRLLSTKGKTVWKERRENVVSIDRQGLTSTNVPSASRCPVTLVANYGGISNNTVLITCGKSVGRKRTGGQRDWVGYAGSGRNRQPLHFFSGAYLSDEPNCARSRSLLGR